MTEREILAAEHALRLLEGKEGLEARRLQSTDAAFAADVLAWQERLAPLFDEIAPVEPGSDLWQRIERALGEVGAGADILAMRRTIRRWQGATALAAAASIALALVAVPPLLREPTPAPAAQTQEPAPLLVASLGGAEAPGSIAATFVPQTGELLITATALLDRPGRSQQLWIIPVGGAPISLGLLTTDQPSRRRLPTTLAAQFRPGATVALSVEPIGGSPTGSPTGPVIAAGSLQTV